MLKMFVAGSSAVLALHATAVAPRIAAVSEADADSPLRLNQIDHTVIPPGEPACGQTAWPYYEPQCIRRNAEDSDQSSPSRRVRIIVIDRASNNDVTARANRQD